MIFMQNILVSCDGIAKLLLEWNSGIIHILKAKSEGKRVPAGDIFICPGGYLKVKRWSSILRFALSAW